MLKCFKLVKILKEDEIMSKWNKKRRGFTLVELVIVIAILGILAMYALPKYQGIIKEARSSEARAQLGSVRSALGIYYAKNHGQFPTYDVFVSGSIFADGKVPEVEITRKDGIVVRNNKVKDGGHQVPLTSFSWHPEIYGCWRYAVTSDHTQADIRLNSKYRDPAHPDHYWYQY